MALSSALLLAACTPSPDGLTPPNGTTPPSSNIVGTGSTRVLGYVVSSNSGAVVAGSTVTVTDSGGTTVGTASTDDKGTFVLSVAPGTYSLSFAKPGYAASRVVNYPVLGAGQQLNVVQKMAFSSTYKAVAPELGAAALEGETRVALSNDPAKAYTFSASKGVTLGLTVTAGDAGLSPEIVYANVGLENTPGAGYFGSRALGENDPKNTVMEAKLAVTGNALRGIRGPTYLNLVAYDYNSNRVNSYIPVNITDDQPVTTPLGAFLDTRAMAYTVAQKLGYNSGVRPTAAPTEESQMWAELKFNYQAGLQGDVLGFRVFGSADNTAFRLVRTVAAADGFANGVRISDPALVAGQKMYYYVQAYTSTQSINSPVVDITPLDSFKLTDLTPGNRSGGVSLTPTLSWTVDKKVGDYRKFYALVNDYPSLGAYCFWGDALCGDTREASNNVYTDDGKSPALTMTGNTYSVLFNENGKALLPKLEAFHSYSFDVSAAAFSADGRAVSIAQDYYNIFSPNGGCNFGGPVCEGLISTFTTGNGSN
ncbi:hypothetical protein SU48_05370 [Deinococcus puniceus]|uniref:Carboxypeptidase regulatory-like domain-containing protein n=1 Tax=Deinococcus puniceus TaxID=1182568 RepID=A0A172T8F7_9DEIO|nr:hypothetical protein SU48_05370 [Deinococcus puniceus]